jgi:hypothetical protein
MAHGQDSDELAAAICGYAAGLEAGWQRLAQEAEDAAVSWGWAPRGSELHRPERAWTERYQPRRSPETSGDPPPGDECDRFARDGAGRVVVAHRAPIPGAERLVECFRYEPTSVVAIGYVPDRGLYRVARLNLDEGTAFAFAACESLWPGSPDRVAMVELYRWRDGEISELQRIRFVPDDGELRQQSAQTYRFEFNASGELIGCVLDGERLWGLPALSEFEVQYLEQTLTQRVADRAYDLLEQARPPDPVYCIGLIYSPGLPDDSLLVAELALGLEGDRRTQRRPHDPLRLWHPAGFSIQLGEIRPQDESFYSDSLHLARELRTRDDEGVTRFFSAVVDQLRERNAPTLLPTTEDLVLVAIDDSRGPSVEDIARSNRRETINELRREGWLP